MIARLPEINRVLRAVQTLAVQESRIPIETVVRHCREIVIEGLLPDHEQTLQFAATLGLLAADQVEVALTDDGLAFLDLNVDATYELSADQIRYLVRRHYLDGALHIECKDLLSAFSPSYGPERFIWSATDGPELPGAPWLVEHLCQLGVLERMEDGLRTSEVFSAVVGRFRDEPKGLTEEKLREYLREKKEVGDFAEDIVVAFERERLRANGQRLESNCVRRISKLRENAGYDIESFDAAAPGLVFDRFIEVKGARTKDLHFIWSVNEMKMAQELGDRYWIYFQGGIDMKSRSVKTAPLLFQNPIKSIMENSAITKTPHGLLVQAKVQGAPK